MDTFDEETQPDDPAPGELDAIVAAATANPNSVVDDLLGDPDRFLLFSGLKESNPRVWGQFRRRLLDAGVPAAHVRLLDSTVGRQARADSPKEAIDQQRKRIGRAKTPDDLQHEIRELHGLVRFHGILGNPAAALVELAKEKADLFHDANSATYAAIFVGTHRETHPIRSRRFASLLRKLGYSAWGEAPKRPVIAEALDQLEAIALYDGPTRPVHTRLAEANGAAWFDLGDAEWRAIEITSLGWRIADLPEVYFLRPAGMLALPDPVPGGSLAELQALLRIADETWPLVNGWLSGATNPFGPYAILGLGGEQGSGKSMTSKMLRWTVDPHVVDAQAQPRSERDLAIAARSRWIVNITNVSRIEDWLSDALCRLASGEVFATRALWTDSDERAFTGARPILLNGIGELGTRPDLLSREISIVLPSIPDTARRPERDLWAEFASAHPRLLGALCDGIVAALARRDQVPLPSVRMADFARWVMAAEPGIGLAEGTFLAAYQGNIDDAHLSALEFAPIGVPMRQFAAGLTGPWRGTMDQLRHELERIAGPVAGTALWPKNANAFGVALRRILPPLRKVGVTVMQLPKREPGTGRRLWEVQPT